MPSEMTIFITLLIVLNYPLQSLNQDAINLPLPLGQFRYVTPFPGSGSSLSDTTPQSPLPFALLERPRLDTSVPAGVDAAAIAAQGAAIQAFINACPREMRLAGLRCPCAHPGGICADPYSVCSLENKCKCDGRLGYPDATATRCIPYVISTTTIPTTTTAKTTTRTTTTTSTTSTTTTTTIPLTTTPPITKFTACGGVGGSNPPVQTLTIADTIEITSPAYPTATLTPPLNCLYSFLPPAGKSVKVEFVPPFDIRFPLCSSYIKLIYPPIADGDDDPDNDDDGIIFYCSDSTQPPASFAFRMNVQAGIQVFIRDGIPNPYVFKLRITVI